MGRRGSNLSHLLKENRSCLPLALSGKILCVLSAFHSLSGMGFLTWAAAGIRMEPGAAWDCSPGCSQGSCRAGGSDPRLSPAEGQPKTCARQSGLIFLPQQWQLVSPLCLPLPRLTTSLRLRCQPNGKNPQSLWGTTSQGRPFWDLDLGLHCWCLLESRPTPVSHVLSEHLKPCTISRTGFHSDFTDIPAGLFVVPSPNKMILLLPTVGFYSPGTQQIAVVIAARWRNPDEGRSGLLI